MRSIPERLFERAVTGSITWEEAFNKAQEHHDDRLRAERDDRELARHQPPLQDAISYAYD